MAPGRSDGGNVQEVAQEYLSSFEAWKLVKNCFDPIPFECVGFQTLSQIIANLTRENLREREAEITNLPWTQTEKDNALARSRIGPAPHTCLAQRVSCGSGPPGQCFSRGGRAFGTRGLSVLSVCLSVCP